MMRANKKEIQEARERIVQHAKEDKEAIRQIYKAENMDLPSEDVLKMFLKLQEVCSMNSQYFEVFGPPGKLRNDQLTELYHLKQAVGNGRISQLVINGKHTVTGKNRWLLDLVAKLIQEQIAAVPPPKDGKGRPKEVFTTTLPVIEDMISKGGIQQKLIVAFLNRIGFKVRKKNGKENDVTQEGLKWIFRAS